MKIAVIGVGGIPVGKHNLKDPRLDRAHELVEAKKKTCAQVDVLGEEEAREADAILVSRERLPDLILHDLEFVEMRLGRAPGEGERAVLEKIRAALEQERPVSQAGLHEEEARVVSVFPLLTRKPVTVAAPEEMSEPESLMLRAFADAGWICFLTVGGKENRAWPIRRGATAWEAAGVIHSDIQRGFIRAEVIGFSDFLEAGGETAAKRAGKLRLEQRHYVMQDYDVVNFRFNK
jgi:ribosome-binding ATPase YchF (GTP1/OBG family)